MIIFLDDDRAYLSWIRRHGDGFVLDGPKQHRRHQSWLHRSTCADIRQGKRKHWTTGTKLKACSMDPAELSNWARNSLGKDAAKCEACHPQAADCLQDTPGQPLPLTRLSGNVLNYVVETAIVHLANCASRYRLTVGDIADCLHKTPAQLSQAFARLLDADYLVIDPRHKNGTFSDEALVQPTIAGMRAMDAYPESSDAELRAEIARLGASG